MGQNGITYTMTRYRRGYGIMFVKIASVGMFGMNKAFRIKPGSECELEAITNTEIIRLSDLVGYEIQKAELTENTEAFGGDSLSVVER